MIKEGCHICAQIAGDSEGDLLSPILSYPNARAVSFETEHFVVFPSLGALTAGHALVSPKQHLRSFAVCPVEWYAEYTLLLVSLSHGLEELTGKPVQLFEHGTGSGGHVACSVSHAHQHVVPTSFAPLVPQLPGVDWIRTRGGLDSIVALAGPAEYLYYQRSSDGRYVGLLQEGGQVESQLMRRVFAIEMGMVGSSDWRLDPRVAEVNETYSLLQAIAPNCTQTTSFASVMPAS